MRYIVLHREGTQWMNLVGNSLHVPFIDAETDDEAVETAIMETGKEAPMYLVLNVSNGGVLVAPHVGWIKEPF